MSMSRDILSILAFLEIVFTVISVEGMLSLGRVPGCVCVSLRTTLIN